MAPNAAESAAATANVVAAAAPADEESDHDVIEQLAEKGNAKARQQQLQAEKERKERAERAREAAAEAERLERERVEALIEAGEEWRLGPPGEFAVCSSPCCDRPGTGGMAHECWAPGLPRREGAGGVLADLAREELAWQEYVRLRHLPGRWWRRDED